jgi:hypothetical protein
MDLNYIVNDMRIIKLLATKGNENNAQFVKIMDV